MPKEMDKIKSALIESETVMSQPPKQHMLHSKVKELKDSGNEAFSKGSFKESINLYTEAISIPGVPDKELAVLYSNCSVAFLKLGDNLSAEGNAKKSTSLSPTWWKGYYRVAMAYKASKKYQLALENLFLCQQYHDSPKDLNDQIELCTRLICQRRVGHFDPMYFCTRNEKITRWIYNKLDLTNTMVIGLDDFGMKYWNSSTSCAQGHKFYFGQGGVKKDYKTAVDWYNQAAEEGGSEGMYNLAKMLMDGMGYEQDLSESIRLLVKASSQPNLMEFKIPSREQQAPTFGVREAQHSLGLIYEQGTGVPVNYKKARFWYRCAIKNWCGASANNMAIMHLVGLGIPVSVDLAMQYWKLGAGMGNVRCMENLVQNYFELENFENMQQWYLYAVKHDSEVFKPSAVQFQKHFREIITQNFRQEKFTKDLWCEIENGPLKHLIDKKIKSVYDGIKNGISEFHFLLRSKSICLKLDASTPDKYKKSITLAHRKDILSELKKLNLESPISYEADLKPMLTVNLLDLKQIFLEEMWKENKDHIYQGFFLNLTIIEDPIDKFSAATGIRTVACDQRKSYQRLFLYNYNPNKIELQENLGFGSKLTIVNPYYRIARDGSPLIRVDNINTIFVHSDLKNVKICRYCGNENYEGPTIKCRSCKKCYYCSKECLKLDTSELKHYLICKK